MESLQENKWYENITLKEAKTFIQSNIQNVDRSMKTIGRSVIAIGYYLKNVRDRSLYLEDGYNSIWDFAAGEYEISKSAASRYMAMNDRYSVDGNSPVVAEQYREFGKSQLQEMLYLTDEQLEEVTPDSTVAQIRKLRQPEEPPGEEEDSGAAGHRDGLPGVVPGIPGREHNGFCGGGVWDGSDAAGRGAEKRTVYRIPGGSDGTGCDIATKAALHPSSGI